MIKVSQSTILQMEALYPGITEQINHFESEALSDCPHCTSRDTARVQVGVIGRTIHLSTATSKFHLIPNRNGELEFFCNHCRRYFAK